MAIWQVGPYDNDEAVEWCGCLESLTPTARRELVFATLAAAAAPSGRDLAAADAARVVAAAATVLQSLIGTPTSDSPFAPRFLLDGKGILVDQPLRALAIMALDKV